MNRRFRAFVVRGILLAGTGIVPACAMDGDDEVEDVAIGELAAESRGGHDQDGRRLFRRETFGGNGRTCATCHPSDGNQSGTLSPDDVGRLLRHDDDNPLFQHDAADVIGGDTFTRLRQHATILVNKSLPANVRLTGSPDRSVVLARGIPTTMNTPALDPVLMYDGRHPTLQAQARGAILDHAESGDVTDAETDAIAEFQQGLFNRQNVKKLATHGRRPTMPFGRTASEKRGRRFFISDNQVDPEENGEGPEANGQFCGVCHSGDMLNETSTFFGESVFPGVPAGTRFFTVFVSELNPIGNPVRSFEFTNPDGTVTTVTSPDPGLALVTGDPATANFFKINSLWGIEETAPYFHDNSAKTFAQLMDHYAVFLNITSGGIINLSAQDKADISAYMRLL